MNENTVSIPPTMSSVLHVDMLYVRWRNSGMHGHMVVRGTSDAFLAILDPLTAKHNVNGNSYYYLQIHSWQNQRGAGKKETYAVSLKVDVREHPSIFIFYKDKLTDKELLLSSIDIRHNYLLFRKGIFTDDQLKKNGCSALVVCRSAINDAMQTETPSSVSPPTPQSICFVNWRQCNAAALAFLNNLHDARQTHTVPTSACLHTPMSSFVYNTQDHTMSHGPTPEQTPPQTTEHATSSWETRFYRMFQKSVDATFNLSSATAALTLEDPTSDAPET